MSIAPTPFQRFKRPPGGAPQRHLGIADALAKFILA